MSAKIRDTGTPGKSPCIPDGKRINLKAAIFTAITRWYFIQKIRPF
jgi:hypothetical protein